MDHMLWVWIDYIYHVFVPIDKSLALFMVAYIWITFDRECLVKVVAVQTPSLLMLYTIMLCAVKLIVVHGHIIYTEE